MISVYEHKIPIRSASILDYPLDELDVLLGGQGFYANVDLLDGWLELSHYGQHLFYQLGCLKDLFLFHDPDYSSLHC